MPRSAEENPLILCSLRCTGLLSDLKHVPQVKTLHLQTKALRSALRKSQGRLRSYSLDSLDLGPTKYPGLHLLAVYIFTLRNACGYYGLNHKTEWRLNSDQRASTLGGTNRPFDRFSEKLSDIAQELHVLTADKRKNGEKWAQNFCKWAESMIHHWDFFKRELELARVLAIAASAVSDSDHFSLTTTMPETPATPLNCRLESGHDMERTDVWDSIRDALAAEGIGADAVAKVADDIKACVRHLVQSKRAEAVLDEPKSPSHTANATESTASEELIKSPGRSENLPDQKNISSRLADALDRINTDIDGVTAEFLEAAFKQDGEESTKNFRLTLDAVYFTACRDTIRARGLAKLAKRIQDNATPHIRELMMSKKRWAKMKAEGGDSTNTPEPVTSWYLGRCREAWEYGKNGRNTFNAGDLAFCLPRFIGELAKFGVFQENHIHMFIKTKLDTTMGRDQFVAVYQLLRFTGRMCEGNKMKAHFKEITQLIDNEDTSNCVRLLAQELTNLRDSGWKLKELKVIEHVEAEMSNSVDRDL